MTKRVESLRKESHDIPVTLSAERAQLITEFYEENYGKYPVPVLRSLAFKYLCEKKTIYIGKYELIVGERGPFPKAVPTYPELTCHSVEDLEILNTREKTCYRVNPEDIEVYREQIIPYWRGRTMRDRIFRDLSDEWKDAYEAGIFTEFMEQRAPGHTTLDGKFYNKGLLDFKEDIAISLSGLDFINDPEATAKQAQLKGMDIACDAAIVFAQRHAELAEKMAGDESDHQRKKELETIASNCRWVPAHAPRNLWEALQMYWFIHLGTITELNGWDAMNPGHLDRYFYPFYKKDLEDYRLTREGAKELIECFWIKFNNHQ
jgi:pyruvate-formate lyase